MQAIALIRDASQHDDVALAVSWSGDVREANMVERVIYGIIDFFDAGAPERRMNEAREAVISKLTNELRILSGPASGSNSAVLTAEMSGMVNQVAKELIDAGTISKKGLPGDLRDAIQNIKDITAEPDKKSRKLIWKAVAEQRNENKKVSIDAAKGIAKYTESWKESLNISTRDAFRLASNAWKLYESKQILPEEGKEILLCAGRLSSRHGFSHKDALSYAIDLHIPLKKLGFGMDSIERVMKSLDYAIPELRTQSDRVRLSAAIRYLQLQDAEYKQVKPIDEIRRSLPDLPRLQQAMPRGCLIDQIHQGVHIRGLSKHSFPEPSPSIDNDKSLTESEKALTHGANSLMSAEPLGSNSNPVHGVLLPEVFAKFYKLHVEDLVRGNRFDLYIDNQIDTEFSEIEAERRKNPKTFSTEQYHRWAQNRIRWAGSERAVQIISGLESQSLFADVGKFCSQHFLNDDAYSAIAAGHNNLAQTSFQAYKITGTDPLVDEFSLRQTHYVNATRLLANLTESGKAEDESHKPNQVNIPLIPTPGPETKASADSFSVKRSVTLSLSVPKLPDSPPTCRIKEVSEEWDLMVDWDAWMTMRPEVGTL
ncbi:MAG: hypothetical protein RL369_446 [Pseudomonadota bacterium]|jgi:hypothetical protein